MVKLNTGPKLTAPLELTQTETDKSVRQTRMNSKSDFASLLDKIRSEN
jgi:hypothetical protein